MIGVLDQIVFDECHVVKNSIDEFRLKVLDLNRLGRY